MPGWAYVCIVTGVYWHMGLIRMICTDKVYVCAVEPEAQDAAT